MDPQRTAHPIATDMMSTSRGEPDPSWMDRAGGDAPEPVHFVAPDFTSWTVHDVHDPGTSGGRSLIFVSPAGFRRVRGFPPNWRSLSAGELWELSWRR